MLPTACLSVLVAMAAAAAEPGADEAKERIAWEAFAKSLSTEAFAKDYPGPLRDLDSADAEKRTIALNVLGASRAIEAIPFIVPLLDSRDHGSRERAAASLGWIVSGIELRRRDHAQEAKHPMKIILRPRTAEEPDLRPLRWVVRRMLTAGEDYGTAGYAATMAAYIGLPELEKELKALLRSRHPSVSQSAASALRILGLEEKEAEEPTLEVLPWPGGKEPEGFMRSIKLVALSPALCEKIVRGAAGRGEAPREKPNIKSPAEAAAYFGSHVNMVEPPKYMAVYSAPSGETWYIFSGGMHWGRKPLFSQAEVLLETGAIRPCR